MATHGAKASERERDVESQLAYGTTTFQSLHTIAVLVIQSLQTQPLYRDYHTQVFSGYVHVSVHRSSIDRELNFSRPNFYQVSYTKKKKCKSFRIMGSKVHIDWDTLELVEVLDVVA